MSGGPGYSIDVSSTDKGTLLLIQSLQKEMDKLGTKVDQVGQRTSTTAKVSASSFKTVLSALTKLGPAIIGPGSVVAALGAWKSANKEIIDQQDKMGKQVDELNRKFRVQSGLRGVQAEAAQKQIGEIAIRQAVDYDVASEAATQLVSSGFSPEQASGGALEEFLRVKNAANLRGANVDNKGLAESITSYLQSQGMELNEKNMAKVGRGTQILFRSKNLQVSDLTDLAGQGAALKGALTPEEQLGSFAELRQVMGSAESATGLRNIVSRLQTAGGSKDKVAALKQLGLAPGDVDFVGENLDQVLGKMDAGLKGVAPEKQNVILKKLFEEAGVSVAKNLISGRAGIRDNVAAQADQSGFEADVIEASSGPNAAKTRMQTRLFLRRAEAYDEGDLMLEAADAEVEDRGSTPLMRDVKRNAAQFYRYVTKDAKGARDLVYGEGTGTHIPDRLGSQAISGNEAQTQAAAEQKSGMLAQKMDAMIEALNRNTEETRRNSDTTGSGRDPSRPGPKPPSSGLSRR